MTFLVGDGVLPSNEGRGYVLRRIIRRAVQQARTIGLDDLWRITDVVAEQMSPWYPELSEHRERIREIVKTEEERFSQTLERGLKLFEEIAAKGTISGEDAFLLHDTYGFPLELTTGARLGARHRDRRGNLHAAHVRAAGALTRGCRASGGTGGRVRQARPASRPSSSATRRPRC